METRVPQRIEVYTDAFEFRYGVSVKLDNGSLVLGNYWESDDRRPIHEKEADAVLKLMQSVKVFFYRILGLKFLEEQGVACTVVVPKMNPFPIWWPKLEINSVGSVCLGLKGVVMISTKTGFVVDLVGLRWPLFAFRLPSVKLKI